MLHQLKPVVPTPALAPFEKLSRTLERPQLIFPGDCSPSYIEGATGYPLHLLKHVDEYAHFYRCPEIFAWWSVAKILGEDLLQKDHLSAALTGRVSRPQTSFESLPYLKDSEDPGIVRHVSESLCQRLRRSGGLFIKPAGMYGIEQSACGAGILRLRLETGRLSIEVTDDDRLKRLTSALAQWQPLTEGQRISLSPQSEADLTELVTAVLAKTCGDKIVEDEIPIPYFQGRTWEIRAIVQAPDRRPVITGWYVKLGPDNFVANISREGEGLPVSDFLGALVREHFPALPASQQSEIGANFLKGVRNEALGACAAISEYLQREIPKYMTGIPPELLYVRSAAVDITAALTPAGLQPVVIEFQYPRFGYSGLAASEPELAQVVEMNSVRMEEEGLQLLRSLYRIRS